VYLDHYRFGTTPSVNRRRVGEEPLFLSEIGRPLTENTISLLFGRLRKRAGMMGKEVGSSLLRDRLCHALFASRGGSVHFARTAGSGGERQGETLFEDEQVGDGEVKAEEAFSGLSIQNDSPPCEI